MKNIYLLSGLGADKRVFDFINLSGYSLNYIAWIEPIDNETIEEYSKRLLKQIHHSHPTLIGVSFGGIIAVEIGKLIQTEKIIIISSAKTKLDIPLYLRIIGKLGLHKLIATRFLKSVNELTFWFFGTKTKKDKELLKSIIKETDSKFLKWAITKILNWKNTKQLTNLTHIHGTKDRILPPRTPDYEISYGGHLMIINKGDELSGLINKILS